MPSRTGKLAGLGALSALFTESNSISLTAPSSSSLPPLKGVVLVVVDEEAHFRADSAISACALVGGLKLESRTTRRFTFEAGRRGPGSRPTACGNVHRMRKASGDDWKDVSERAKKSTSCLGFGRMTDDEFVAFGSAFAMML
ncbi:hypothetical protein V8C44DRAFT_335960 [Trichoderma aethiopicum]